MANVVKLTANISGSIGKTDLVTILVNLDHVLKVTPDNAGSGSKLTYTTGQTERVIESRDLIEKLANHEDVGAYVEPEPNVKDA